MGGVPEAPPRAGPRGRPLPALRRPGAAGRRAARRGVPPAARPRRLDRAAGGLRAALPGAVGRRARPAPATTAVAAALRELGFQLTRRGIRRGDVRGRPAAHRLAGQVARAGRGGGGGAGRARRRAARRSCCATPSWPRSAPTTRSPACSTPPPARPATRCSRSPATRRTAPLRPLLVSGRGLRCAPADAEVLLEALQAEAEDRFQLPEWDTELDGLLVELHSSGAEWVPRAWVELATRLLVDGTTERARGHARAARRGLGLPAAQRAGRPDRGHHRRVRAADARALAAPRPRRPGEGRLQLGRRLRRPRPGARQRRLRALRAQAPATCSRPPRTARSRPARRTCTRSSARSRRRRPNASPRSTRELIARARRPRRGARALADRHALPRRGAAHPAGAPPRRAPGPARRRRRTSTGAADFSQRVPLAAGATGVRARRRRRGHRRGAGAGRPRARARRARLGGRAARARRSGGSRSCCRSTAPPARSPRPTARWASCRGEAAASLAIEPRAGGYLRCELTAATPEEGAAVRRRAGRAGERVRRPALPRRPPAGRPGGRRLRRCSAACCAAGRRSPSGCTPCRPTSPATRSAPRRSPRAWRRHVGPGPARVHAAQRGGPRGPRRGGRARTAATRRCCATSGSERARPARRPRGPARRGRPRRRPVAGRAAPGAQRVGGVVVGVAPGLRVEAPAALDAAARAARSRACRARRRGGLSARAGSSARGDGIPDPTRLDT